MLKNFHLKLFALFLAVIFWAFIVSGENAFAVFPEEIPVTPLNLGSEFVLKTSLPKVKLTLRAEDRDIFRRLTAEDFEAAVDLKDAGVGKHKVSVTVSSRSPEVSIVRVSPPVISLEIESLKQKAVFLKLEQKGEPFEGYSVESITLKEKQVKVRGPESIVKNITEAKALVIFDGTEKEDMVKMAKIQSGEEFSKLTNVSLEFEEVEAEIKLKAPVEENNSSLREREGEAAQ